MEAVGISVIGLFAYYYAKTTSSFIGVVPILGLIALSSQKLLPVLQQIYSSWTHIQSNKAAISSVMELLDGGAKEPSNYRRVAIDFKKDLVIDNISFQYSVDLPMVLQSLSITIKKGEVWGFIGQTGCGKSTLLDIIMGLLEPTKGSIRVDGKPLDKASYVSWREKIAHVPQSIYLADATIAENIAFGHPVNQIDYELLKKVSIQSNISSFVNRLPNKFNAIVGERGIKFSGGQRQRIGIARALYKRAEILILDEATSALDVKTETQVMDSISKLDHTITVLMVAHRMSTLKACDHIVELRGGNVIRIGTYDELMNQQC
jgi:ATP-binding cassette subfamily B protein